MNKHKPYDASLRRIRIGDVAHIIHGAREGLTGVVENFNPDNGVLLRITGHNPFWKWPVNVVTHSEDLSMDIGL